MTIAHLKDRSIRILPHVLCMILVCIATSCHDNKNEPDALRPTLDDSYITVPVGQVKVVNVNNAIDVLAEHIPSFLEINGNGNKLEIYGKEIGKADVDLRADGYLLKCTVEVIDVPDIPEEDDDLPKDIDAQLADESIRMGYGDMIIKYDTPGNLFATSSDGRTAIVQSLVTGTNMQFFASDSFIDTSEHKVPPYTLASPSLVIDGRSVELKKAVVHKATATRLWLMCVPCHNDDRLWLVLGR